MRFTKSAVPLLLNVRVNDFVKSVIVSGPMLHCKPLKNATIISATASTLLASFCVSCIISVTALDVKPFVASYLLCSISRESPTKAFTMSLPNLPFRLFIVCEYVDPARLAPALYVFCAACDAVFAVFCAACDTVFAVFCAACDTVFAPLDTVFDTAFVPLDTVFFAFFRHFLTPPSEGASRWNRAFGRSTAPSVVATPPENIAHVTASVSVSAIDARARRASSGSSRVVRIAATRRVVRIAATRRAVRRGARRARARSHGERRGGVFHAIRARRGASARERVRREREFNSE